MSKVFHQPTNLWFRIVLKEGLPLVQDKEPTEAKWQASQFIPNEVLTALNPIVIFGQRRGFR